MSWQCVRCDSSSSENRATSICGWHLLHLSIVHEWMFNFHDESSRWWRGNANNLNCGESMIDVLPFLNSINRKTKLCWQSFNIHDFVRWWNQTSATYRPSTVQLHANTTDVRREFRKKKKNGSLSCVYLKCVIITSIFSITIGITCEGPVDSSFRIISLKL